jgi:hypothetical protein
LTSTGVNRWLIFGRTEYAQPLRFEGFVEAEGAEEASARALEQKGRDWVELTLILESAVRWVLKDDSEEVAADD